MTISGAYIVADCCVNWSNLLDLKTLIAACKEAGADAVKVQAFTEQDIASHPRADELRKIILTEDRLQEIRRYCDSISIPLGVTVTDTVTMEWAAPLARYLKIRFADRYNNDLIRMALETMKGVHLSCDHRYLTDPATQEIVADPGVSLLYCVPEYPPSSRPDFSGFRTGFTGFSSHYRDPVVPYIAWCRGARILEVHVKLPGSKPIDSAVSISTRSLALLRDHTYDDGGFRPASEVWL